VRLEPDNVLVLPASKTKTGEHRTVPITSRLRQVLEFRRHDASGEPFGPDAYVFGDETGAKLNSFRTAWENCRKRAGVTGLHWHDLRRETASRLLETPGVALHDVAEWIGHSSVTTTARYLSTSALRRQQTLKRFEEFRQQQSAAVTPDAIAGAAETAGDDGRARPAAPEAVN
jgi:integrase